MMKGIFRCPFKETVFDELGNGNNRNFVDAMLKRVGLFDASVVVESRPGEMIIRTEKVDRAAKTREQKAQLDKDVRKLIDLLLCSPSELIGRRIEISLPHEPKKLIVGKIEKILCQHFMNVSIGIECKDGKYRTFDLINIIGCRSLKLGRKPRKKA